MALPGRGPGRGPGGPGRGPGRGAPGGLPLKRSGRPPLARPEEPELRKREPIPDGDYETLPELPAGRELDALVARHIIGLTRLKVFAYFEGAQSDVYRLYSEGGKTFILPEYSREMARAWEIVLALPECCFEIKTIAGGQTTVMVAFVDRGRASKRLSQAAGETAPLAVCRAALLAAGKLE